MVSKGTGVHPVADDLGCGYLTVATYLRASGAARQPRRILRGFCRLSQVGALCDVVNSTNRTTHAPAFSYAGGSLSCAAKIHVHAPTKEMCENLHLPKIRARCSSLVQKSV